MNNSNNYHKNISISLNKYNNIQKELKIWNNVSYNYKKDLINRIEIIDSYKTVYISVIKNKNNN